MKPIVIKLALSLFAFSLSFNPDWSSKALIMLVLVTFANKDIKKMSFKWDGYLKMMTILLVYIIVNSVLSNGPFPSDTFIWVGLWFVFYLTAQHINGKIGFNTELVLKSFLTGVLTVGVINFFAFIFKTGFRLDNFFNAWENNSIVDIHKLYYGMYLNMAHLILLKFLSEKKIRLGSFVIFDILVLLLVFFTGALSSIFLLILLSLLYLSNQYWRQYYKSFSIVILIVPFVLLFAFMLKGFQEIFQEIDGDGSRIRNYNVNKEIVLEKPFFGHGIGNEFITMQNHRLPASWEYKNKYNAHNQYFQFLIGGGLTFLILVLLFFYKSVYCKGFLGLGFATIVLYTFLVESMLGRHHGQIYFSFFLVMVLYDFGIVQPKSVDEYKTCDGAAN